MLKGIILAGGLGTRLRPLTKITNKHLLPIYNKPMIFYPIEILVNAGVTDIMVVTGGNNAGDFLRLIGNGKHLGIKDLRYAYQEGEGGIAAALALAEDFAAGSKIIVVLGDNIIEKNIAQYVKRFKEQEKGGRLLLKEVPDPHRFGVAEMKDNRIIKIAEKPKKPKSAYAVTGIYMYDEKVFSMIKGLKPSKRGELEITDVNNKYIRKGTMEFDILSGFWTDAGTFDSLYRANSLIAQKIKKQKK